MATFRSAQQVADELGVSKVAICEKLKRIGAPKVGNSYIVDDETYAYLKARAGQVGRPKGTRNKRKA